jgi:hypothetical protein
MGACRTRANEWEPSHFPMVENKLLPYHLVHHHVLFLYRWCISSKDGWFVVGDSFFPPSHFSLLGIAVAVVTVIVVVMVVVVILVIIIIIIIIIVILIVLITIIMMMMMMILIIVIIHHLILDLLGIEFHYFLIYGVFGLITRVISLKS